MADDEDAIYIDVIPRVDDSAADSAVAKLKGKFKDVAGNIGPDFMDALNNSGVLEEFGKKVGSTLSEAVGSDVKEMSSAIGVDLEDAIGKVINKDWSGLGASLGKGLGGKLTEALGINELLGSNGIDGVIDKFHTLSDTVKSFHSGDLGGALQGANALTGGALQPVADLHDQIKQSVSDTRDLIDDTIGAGLLGSKAAGATKLFAEAAAPVAGSLALAGPIEDQLNKIPWVKEHTELPGTGGDWFKKPFREMGGYLMHPSRLGNATRQYDKNGNFIGDGPPQPNSTDRLYSSVFGSDTAGTGGGGGKTTANVAEVQTNSAVVSAGSVTLGGNISIPGMGGVTSSSGGRTTSTGVAAAGGDSGSMASLYSGGGGTTIGKGHYASGGVLPGDSPGYDNMVGVLPGGNAVGLEGGEGVINPGGMQLPGAKDIVAGMNKGFLPLPPTTGYLPRADPNAPGAQARGPGVPNNSYLDSVLGSLGGHALGDSPEELAQADEDYRRSQRGNFNPGILLDTSTTSSSGMPHYDEGTTSVGGDPNNTALATPPTQPNEAGGGGEGKQQTQLGKGQGGGISGGGLIGAAEQAGVAAAGIAGFGGGAIAAQMAVQETNLAVQKASQSAAALATAPFETLGLGGGMMGAPKVNVMGGWIGKLIAGELGSQTSLPNLAGGSTQPPKKPDQKPDQDQFQSEDAPKGPSGDKDDPMHVNVTNNQAPPQGSATSAMSTMPAMTMAP